MLMHEPEILFLDEPTIGVDVLAKRNILQFVKDLNREKGVTVMITSHDMDDLEQLAGRIVMIDKGRIAFDGDFRALRPRVRRPPPPGPGDRGHRAAQARRRAPRPQPGQPPPLHVRRRAHADPGVAATGRRSRPSSTMWRRTARGSMT